MFDPDTQQIAAITRREHNDAHRLIEECMLAANVCAADFIERNKHSCLYRVHDSPPPERLQKLREFLAGLHLTLGGGDKPTAADYGAVVEAVKPCPYSDTVQTALLRSMQQAVYSPVNIGHYGLNYERYTHFTSPIRRYPDLLVHRTIRAILAKTKYVPQIVVDATEFMQSRSARTLLEATDKSPTVWAQLGTITSAAERRADEASRDLVSWLKCTYMQRFVGRKFTGEVTGCVGAGAYVTLKSLFVDGFLHVSKFGNDYFEYYENEQRFVGRTTGRQIGPGTSLKVTVEEVDPQTRNIAFSTRGGPRYERFPDFNRKEFERDNPRRERVKTSRGSKHRKK